MSSSVSENTLGTVNRSLENDGFAIIPNVFTKEEIAAVSATVRDLQQQVEDALERGVTVPFTKPAFGVVGARQRLEHLEILYPSTWCPVLRESVVYRRCSELAGQLRTGYSLSFDDLFIKQPRNDSVTIWHRDSVGSPLKIFGNIFQRRLHFWVPLQDVTPENGCLEFIAGSHKEPGLITATPGRRISCPMKAGAISIHTSHSLHFSGPNTTEAPRVAWALTFGRLGAGKLLIRRMLKRVPGQLGSGSLS
jgi:ectoine hydroxylase-related dioxygenase (phytanoyl-CoA dioxygenase family)